MMMATFCKSIAGHSLNYSNGGWKLPVEWNIKHAASDG
jgi:hypothetical protein